MKKSPVNLDLSRSMATSVMDPVAWEQMKDMALTFFKGRAIPAGIRNPAQLVTVIQTGHEMGMGPMEAVKSLYIVNGTINLYGAAVGKQMVRHGWRVTKVEEDDSQATVTVTGFGPNQGLSYKETYTLEEARKSGYANDSKPAWKPGAARRRKLRYGAISLIVHTYLPEVLGSASGIAEFSEDVDLSQVPVPSKVEVTDEARKIAAEAVAGRKL